MDKYKLPFAYNRLTDYIIWIISTLWLIIDSINGYLLTIGVNFPLSQIFKFIIIILLFSRVITNSKILFLIILILLYPTLLFVYYVLNNIEPFNPILEFSKFLTFLLFYLYFVYCIKIYQKNKILKWFRVFYLGIIILFFNIILGILGFGRPTYADMPGYGVKGFIYAGNELGGLLAIVYPLIFYIIIFKYKGLKRVVLYFALIILGCTIGTKSGILSVLISALSVPLLYTKHKFKFIIAYSFFLIFIIILLITSFSELDIKSINRWIWLYEDGGVNSLIYSNRDEFWNQSKLILNNSNFINKFLGLGSQEKTIEQDHLDALYSFGYLGLIFCLSTYIIIFYNSYKNKTNNSIGKIIILSDVLIIFISFIAGHIWFSAMISIYLAMLNAFSFIKYDKLLFINNFSN